jgi:hypothetical protein
MREQNRGFEALVLIVGVFIVGYFIFTRMTRGMKNNNPFNLRNSNAKWIGKTGVDDKGFVIFDTIENGIRAGVINLKNGYFANDLSISEIVAKYAPADDGNNEISYVDNLCKYSDKFTPDYVPSDLSDYVLICKGIVRVEQGFDAASEDLIVKYLNA